MNQSTGIMMKISTRTRCDLYAIKLGEYIEFRVAKDKPKAITTHAEITRVVTKKKYVNIDQPPYYKIVNAGEVERIPITQTIYEGGRCLGGTTYTKFKNMGGPTFRGTKILKLEGEIAEKVYKRRKEWL